jgi:hypothetical protein
MRKGMKCAKCLAIYDKMGYQTLLGTAANSFQFFHILGRQEGLSKQRLTRRQDIRQKTDCTGRSGDRPYTQAGRQQACRGRARSGKEAGRYSHFRQVGSGQANAGKIWAGDRKV